MDVYVVQRDRKTGKFVSSKKKGSRKAPAKKSAPKKAPAKKRAAKAKPAAKPKAKRVYKPRVKKYSKKWGNRGLQAAHYKRQMEKEPGMYGPAPYTKGATGAEGEYLENHKGPGVKLLGHEKTATEYAPFTGYTKY